jgi:hypothetical protein
MNNMLKYETRKQFINRFHSLIETFNNKYVWNGDVDIKDNPIFRFNGITLNAREMIKVWKPLFDDECKKNIINKHVKYNSKKDIYL